MVTVPRGANRFAEDRLTSSAACFASLKAVEGVPRVWLARSSKSTVAKKKDPMATTSRCFGSERDMVDELCELIAAGHGPWRRLELATEFGYGRGRTDVVAADVTGQVIAFEAKLGRWRDALQQAYRNKCFAHRSYVVLPPQAAHRAASFAFEFERRAVGLCCVTGGKLNVLIGAKRQAPLQRWLYQHAVIEVRASNGQ